MNKFIMWSFPLIVVCVFLTGGVSKPDMPHITLPEIHHAPRAYRVKDAPLIDQTSILDYTAAHE